MDPLNISLRIFIIICLAAQLALSAVNVKLTNIECKVLDKEFGEFTKCSLKAIKRDVAQININVKIDSKPINNASLKLRLAKRGSLKQNYLYQYKVDACEFMRSTRRNPLAEIFYSFFDLGKCSNLNHTCPYSHDLILDSCQMNTKPLGILPISRGDYKIFTTWFKYDKPIATVDVAILVN